LTSTRQSQSSIDSPERKKKSQYKKKNKEENKKEKRRRRRWKERWKAYALNDRERLDIGRGDDKKVREVSGEGRETGMCFKDEDISSKRSTNIMAPIIHK
jgi:hypothetical protein